MRVIERRRSRLVALLVAGALAAACTRLTRQYEYEEEIFLELDGSATIVVNTSVAALVALRNAGLDPRPRARFDRTAARAFFESSVARVTRVSRPWRRHGRRFFQVRLEVDAVSRLSEHEPFSWAAYRFARHGDEWYAYRQVLEGAAGRAPPEAGWTGDELVAVRLHLPSRILYHNATSGEVERGNILVWEQSLADRLAGRPLEIEARFETRSILVTTLWLFGGSFAAAVLVLGGAVWWVMRLGARR